MGRQEKLYHLHDILRHRRTPISRHDLAEQLECSQATLYRLIALLRDEFGAPIEQDAETRNFYYDRHDSRPFQLPGIWISPDELHALLLARALLSEAQPGLMSDELDALRQRIEGLLGDQGVESTRTDELIRVIQPAVRRAPPAAFRTIVEALLRKRRLKSIYRARQHDQALERVLSPQRLTHYRGNWYLEAYCHLREGLRSFAAERLDGLELMEEDAYAMDREQLDAESGRGFGIFSGKPTAEAVLRFSSERARWVADELWHPEQRSRWLDDGRFELSVPLVRSEELVMEILKHGAHVEVVGPQTLRQEVSNTLREAGSRYAS